MFDGFVLIVGSTLPIDHDCERSNESVSFPVKFEGSVREILDIFGWGKLAWHRVDIIVGINIIVFTAVDVKPFANYHACGV